MTDYLNFINMWDLLALAFFNVTNKDRVSSFKILNIRFLLSFLIW